MTLGTLTLVIALLLAAGSAQAQPSKVYRIGVLEMSVSGNAANIDALRKGLRELGYEEGRNFAFEFRSADGRGDRFPALAKELVREKVDVIVTRGTPAVTAAKAATTVIPIVMTSASDPVGTGIVQGLARPGGNVTGLASLSAELAAKRLGLLREILPRLARLAIISNLGNPALVRVRESFVSAGRPVGIEIHSFDARNADDLARAFEAAAQNHMEAVDITVDTVTLTNRQRIAELAVKHRLPTMFPSHEFVDAGGLMSYGADYAEQYRRAATFVDRILKGAKPSELPIEQTSKFGLTINLKTARALGLTLPQSLTLRADHLIQ